MLERNAARPGGNAQPRRGVIWRKGRADNAEVGRQWWRK